MTNKINPEVSPRKQPEEGRGLLGGRPTAEELRPDDENDDDCEDRPDAPWKPIVKPVKSPTEKSRQREDIKTRKEIGKLPTRVHRSLSVLGKRGPCTMDRG